jgi:hypothetical protein
VGGLKKQKVATPVSGAEKSKDVKIVTRHVVTLSEVEKNPRLVTLLYIVSLAKSGISEKALVNLVYLMRENGFNLGYNFVVVGNTPTSKDLLGDLTLLKYIGLVEVAGNKKLVVTSLGRELLSKVAPVISSQEDTIKKLYEALYPKVAPVDVEIDLKSRARR